MGHLSDVNVAAMQMSLRANERACFLFKNWCGNSQSDMYAGVICGTIILCILYELSSYLLRQMETEYVKHARMNCHKSKSVSRNIMMVYLNMMKQMVGYALMLLMMTFNAGVIVSLILSR